MTSLASYNFYLNLPFAVRQQKRVMIHRMQEPSLLPIFFVFYIILLLTPMHTSSNRIQYPNLLRRGHGVVWNG